MKPTAKIPQGALAMVAKRLDFLWPLQDHAIARRIGPIKGGQPALNRETLLPLRLRLELEGAIALQWGLSEDNHRARFYLPTQAGRKQLPAELQLCRQTADIVTRLLTINPETQSCSC